MTNINKLVKGYRQFIRESDKMTKKLNEKYLYVNDSVSKDFLKELGFSELPTSNSNYQKFVSKMGVNLQAKEDAKDSVTIKGIYKGGWDMGHAEYFLDIKEAKVAKKIKESTETGKDAGGELSIGDLLQFHVPQLRDGHGRVFNVTAHQLWKVVDKDSQVYGLECEGELRALPRYSVDSPAVFGKFFSVVGHEDVSVRGVVESKLAEELPVIGRNKTVLGDILGLSSGTIATLTGKRKYDDIDRIQSDFYLFASEKGKTVIWNTWQDAWNAYKKTNPAALKEGKLSEENTQIKLQVSTKGKTWTSLPQNEVDSIIKKCQLANNPSGIRFGRDVGMTRDEVIKRLRDGDYLIYKINDETNGYVRLAEGKLREEDSYYKAKSTGDKELDDLIDKFNNRGNTAAVYNDKVHINGNVHLGYKKAKEFLKDHLKESFFENSQGRALNEEHPGLSNPNYKPFFTKKVVFKFLSPVMPWQKISTIDIGGEFKIDQIITVGGVFPYKDGIKYKAYLITNTLSRGQEHIPCEQFDQLYKDKKIQIVDGKGLYESYEPFDGEIEDAVEASVVNLSKSGKKAGEITDFLMKDYNFDPKDKKRVAEFVSGTLRIYGLKEETNQEALDSYWKKSAAATIARDMVSKDEEKKVLKLMEPYLKGTSASMQKIKGTDTIRVWNDSGKYVVDIVKQMVVKEGTEKTFTFEIKKDIEKFPLIKKGLEAVLEKWITNELSKKAIVNSFVTVTTFKGAYDVAVTVDKKDGDTTQNVMRLLIKSHPEIKNFVVYTRPIKEGLETGTFTEQEAIAIGNKLGIDFDKIPLEQFLKGLNHELEHSDVLDNDDEVGLTAKAHLDEIPDYYDGLSDMEKQYKAKGLDEELQSFAQFLEKAEDSFLCKILNPKTAEDWKLSQTLPKQLGASWSKIQEYSDYVLNKRYAAMKESVQGGKLNEDITIPEIPVGSVWVISPKDPRKTDRDFLDLETPMKVMEVWRNTIFDYINNPLGNIKPGQLDRHGNIIGKYLISLMPRDTYLQRNARMTVSDEELKKYGKMVK